MQTFEHILYKLLGSIAVLTLNRPQTLNALTIPMMHEVQAVLSEVDRNTDIRGLIITGSGLGFCSGQDLRNRPGQGVDIVSILMESYFPTMNAIRQCRVPVIAAVNGTAAGGGCSMALLSDFIIAGESAVFIQVFSRIGLVPDLGSTYLLSRRIGRARALQMMLGNKSVTAKTALEWGLINECVKDESLERAATQLAAQLAEENRTDWREHRQLGNLSFSAKS